MVENPEIKTQDLKKLSPEELRAVVDQYPWFAAARKVLAQKDPTTVESAAIYMVSREITHGIARPEKKERPSRPARAVVGGDFFSSDQYQDASRQEGSIFNEIAKIVGTKDGDATPIAEEKGTEVATETLAKIYEKQGLYELANGIYSKLILRYPEKSAYFATLIEKNKQKI
ncbi:MAG: hypothetical protein K5984_00475 [Bacteroidales bacterium]|nr:hypothetical protein [Bacteroidales bacterium]